MTIDREKVLQAAQAYIQKKRYDRAVAEYRKLIQLDPDDARILLKIGDLQSKMEAHAEAIATYERVGRQYARQGFTLKAIAVYKQIREIIRKHVPELADRYSHIVPLLGELYSQLGLVSDAVAAYEEVAAQMQRAGQDLEAINILKKVLALDNANPLPHLRLAEAYSRVHDNDGAITHFGAAATILADLGRYDDALKVLERLLHHRSDPTFARKAAEIYLARGQANDGMLALPKLQICFQADPKDLDTLALLARSFLMIGQPARAIEVQKEIARIAKEQGKLNVFRETVDVLLKAAPNDEGVRRLAASVAPARRSVTPASEAPIALSDNEIEEIGPGRDTSAGAGQQDSVGPDVPQHMLAEVESLCSRGLHARAIEYLERVILAQPDVVVLRRKLRDILYEQGDFERTAEEMVQIAQIFIDQQAPEYAAEELQAIFTFLADHPVARQMLTELGYAVPGEPQGEPAGAQPSPEAAAAAGYDLYGAAGDGAGRMSSAPVVSAVAPTERRLRSVGRGDLPDGRGVGASQRRGVRRCGGERCAPGDRRRCGRVQRPATCLPLRGRGWGHSIRGASGRAAGNVGGQRFAGNASARPARRGPSGGKGKDLRARRDRCRRRRVEGRSRSGTGKHVDRAQCHESRQWCGWIGPQWRGRAGWLVARG